MARTQVLMLSSCILMLLIASNVQARSVSRFSADIGRFHFPITDDRILDPHANDTFERTLHQLYRDAHDYYDNFDDNQPIEVAAPIIDKLAKTYLGPEYKEKADLLHEKANSSLTAMTDEALSIAVPSGNKTWAVKHVLANRHDYVHLYLQAINDMLATIHFYKVGAYMGVGQTVSCSSYVDDVLSNKDEWAKAGSSAATTLMALVPSFLAFGNLYVPRSSEAFSTSPLVGLGCALYSLGLPVKSLSALKRDQVKSLAVLGFTALLTLASFATVRKSTPNKTLADSTSNDEDDFEDSVKPPTLTDLQGWMNPKMTGGLEDEARHIFAGINLAVGNWKNRYHWWHTPAYVIVALQAVMFGLAIAPLLVNVGAPRFLLSCETNWTGGYLGISAGANAILRYLMWQTGHHEQIRIYALSPKAKSKLQQLVYEKNKGHPSNMETEVPPLYPPTLTRIRAFIHPIYPGLFVRIGWMSDLRGTYKAHTTPTPATISREWTNKTRNAVRRHISMVGWAFKNWRQVIQGGFFTHPPSAARRWRPLVVLMHLSTEGRNFLMTLLTGFLEASLLVVLTFFFAAQWGGNLVITTIAMGLLLVFITLGRAIGLLYVYLSSKVWGLHVIDCSTHDEILGSLRILCSMTGVIVNVNGASYFDGYRLNDMDGYESWKSEYDGGLYDSEDTESEHSGSQTSLGGGGVVTVDQVDQSSKGPTVSATTQGVLPPRSQPQDMV